MTRSKNEIRNARDLPKWFDIRKYDKASGLDSRGWYYQLNLRKDALVCLDFNPLRVFPQTPEEIEGMRQQTSKTYESIVNLLRDDPVPPVPDDLGGPQLEGFFGPRFSPAVCSMTVGGLMHHQRFLSPGRKTYSIRWFDGITAVLGGSGSPIVYKGKPWINRPLYESHNCTGTENIEETRAERTPVSTVAVEVDIRHSDDFLIDAFKSWLMNIREQEATIDARKKFGQQETRRWMKYGVLPFLDLSLWAKETENSIPYRVMADAILEHCEMDAETVRKTVAPLAWSLISEDGGAGALDWLAARDS